MKYIKSLCIFPAGIILFIAACNKPDVVTQMDVRYTGGNTNVKIVHASAFTRNDTMRFKVNDTLVSAKITYSTPFPGGGLNTGGSNMPWYLSIPAGKKKISLWSTKINTFQDSVEVVSRMVDYGPNVYYTTYIADTGINTLMLTFGENRTMPVDGTSRFKFINLIPNLPAADLYYNTTLVASNIPYGFGGPDFIQNKNDTCRWRIRAAGASPTSAAIATYPATTAATQVIPNQRIFTVYSRGYVGATGNRAPAISLTFN